MYKILVPTDFSECSKAAIKVGADIAKWFNGTLVVMHWFDSPNYKDIKEFVPDSANSSNIEEYKEHVSSAIEKLIGSVLTDIPKLEKVPIYDKDPTEIMELPLVKNEVNLIVMGTNGVSNLKERILGSNTQRVVRNAPCPVITLKDYFDFGKLHELVIASDFNNTANADGYNQIFRFFEKHDADTMLLKVVTPSFFEDTQSSMKKINAFREQLDFDEDHLKPVVYNSYSATEGIQAYCNTLGNGMLCVTTKGLTGISYFMSGSLTEDLVNKLNVPVISVKVS